MWNDVLLAADVGPVCLKVSTSHVIKLSLCSILSLVDYLMDADYCV